MGKNDAKIFSQVFNATKQGNFEGRNILYLQKPIAKLASTLKIAPNQLLSVLRKSRHKLYSARLKRPAPSIDTKILTDWNGLLISALARASFVFSDESYKLAAIKCARALLRVKKGQRLRHVVSEKTSQKSDAFLEDYAYFIQGLIDLYETTFDISWLKQAISLQEELDQGFWDNSAGGYFQTATWHEKLLARSKPNYDGATPSGNSVALQNLLKLYQFTHDLKYKKSAEKILTSFGASLSRGFLRLPEMLCGLDYYLAKPLEVVIVKPNDGALDQEFKRALVKSYLPNKISIVVSANSIKANQELLPLLKYRIAQHGKTTAYVCENSVCELPTTDPQIFAQQLVKKSSPGK